MALLIVKADYIAAGACCAQLLWIMQQLQELEINLRNVPICCDNITTINTAKNPVLYSQTKHISIHHHFIGDHVRKGNVCLKFVPTKSQLPNIFTKRLNEEQFTYIH